MKVTIEYKAFVVKIPEKAEEVVVNNEICPVFKGEKEGKVWLHSGKFEDTIFRDCDIALVKCESVTGDILYGVLRREYINDVKIDDLSAEDKDYLTKKGYLK